MEQSQRPQHYDPDREFQEALDQLEDMLQENSTEDRQTPKLHPESANEIEVNDLTDIDLAAFEDAVADIEQYFEQKTK
ncbi:MAG: hypothetical protein PUP90_07275 [Nostoc sp. S4]|nr:hypothetical protein [Nostoc sp. S4]